MSAPSRRNAQHLRDGVVEILSHLYVSIEKIYVGLYASPGFSSESQKQEQETGNLC